MTPLWLACGAYRAGGGQVAGVLQTRIVQYRGNGRTKTA